MATACDSSCSRAWHALVGFPAIWDMPRGDARWVSPEFIDADGDSGRVRERGFADLLCWTPSTIARCRARRCSGEQLSSPLQLPAVGQCSAGSVSLGSSSSSCPSCTRSSSGLCREARIFVVLVLMFDTVFWRVLQGRWWCRWQVAANHDTSGVGRLLRGAGWF